MKDVVWLGEVMSKTHGGPTYGLALGLSEILWCQDNRESVQALPFTYST